jgi:hypothetical protein
MNRKVIVLVCMGILLGVMWLGVSERIRVQVPGMGWTALELQVDYFWIPDRDTELYLAHDVNDRASWIRIAPQDVKLRGAMEWRDAKTLMVPAAWRSGCKRTVEDIRIVWQ